MAASAAASAAGDGAPKLASNIALGPASIRIGTTVLYDDWYTPHTTNFLDEAAAKCRGTTTTHPRTEWKKPPRGVDVEQWVSRDIYAEHPIMCTLLAKRHAMVLGFEWDKVLAALGITARAARGNTTKAFIKRIRGVCGTRYLWLPRVHAEAVLPSIADTRASDGQHHIKRCLPTCLVPFLRDFIDTREINTWDTQMASLLGHMMMTLRIEPSYAPLLDGTRAQLAVNMATAYHGTTHSLWSNMASQHDKKMDALSKASEAQRQEIHKLRQEMRELRTVVSALADEPPPPPPPPPVPAANTTRIAIESAGSSPDIAAALFVRVASARKRQKKEKKRADSQHKRARKA